VQFTMQVKMTNSEMRTPEDLAGVLADAAEQLSRHRNKGRLLDVNGNVVGQFEVVGDDERHLDIALVKREELEDIQRWAREDKKTTLLAAVGQLALEIQS